MALLHLRQITVSYDRFSLLTEADLTLDKGERVCLVGRNGAGKSTLLKILSREIKPDAGELNLSQDLKIALLTQEVPVGLAGTIFDVVAGSLQVQANNLSFFRRLSEQVAHDHSPAIFDKLHHLQNELEATGGWIFQQKIDTILSLMQLDGAIDFNSLSGGMKRRVLLARALAIEPDILLLDEPTNHLDIEAITWLEEFLLRYNGTLLFVTHDRAFLQKLATRIIDLDRGQLTSWPGDYQTYLERKEAALAAEEGHWAVFDKKLAQEEVWIRQGIKARRTRNEGRVRALEKMREERSQRRERVGSVSLTTGVSEKSSRIVLEAKNIGFHYDQRPIIQDFSITIQRGDRIGIIGKNGAGKTTLLHLLLGYMEPHEGSLRLGSQLQVAYYDQLRTQLEADKTVIDNVGGGSTNITINGKSKHIIGYLQDFLFSPERSRMPVGLLSGGERNRVALAKLFAQSHNVLVLDEPTNDLDIETLDLLEEILSEYQGTLLLVSHDRAFINHVVTSTLVFGDAGKMTEYVGGYDDYMASAPVKKTKENQVSTPTVATSAAGKLNQQETRELAALPAQIEKLEKKIAVLHQQMAAQDFYQQDSQKVQSVTTQLSVLDIDLQTAYQRWEQLEERKS